MIIYDRSWNSIVILCTDCPHWAGLRLTQGEAYLAGEAHAIRVHEVEPQQAAAARRLWETRHAQKSVDS